LIIDDKPNAYVYEKGIRASSVFGVWLNKLMLVKKMFRKGMEMQRLEADGMFVPD
jgi:hypothetical protein